MARRSYRRKRSYRKKRRSTRSSVLNAVSVPFTTSKTYTNEIFVPANNKYYMDVATYCEGSKEYTFMGEVHLQDAIATRLNVVAWNIHQQWHVVCRREYEFTNIGNTIVYIQLHQLTSKKDSVGSSFNSVVDTIAGNTTWFPSSAVAATDVFGAPIAGGFAPWIQISLMVYDNAFMDPDIRRFVDKAFKINVGPEVALKPQQTLKFSQSFNKLYKFCPGDHVIAQNIFADFYKGISKAIIMSITGQTARATVSSAPVLGTVKYVNSAPCSVHLMMKDYVKTYPREFVVSVRKTGVNDSGSYLPAGVAYEYGEDNNAPQGAN